MGNRASIIFLNNTQTKEYLENQEGFEPKPMAFDTNEELLNYAIDNPNATCKGLSTKDLEAFIDKNKGKYIFLKEADLRGASSYHAYFGGAYAYRAYLCCADLGGVYSYRPYLFYGTVVDKQENETLVIN
jgi:hypothetical protein